jgi:hypothetical protein
MVSILLACAAMAVKDALGTLLVVAEARGRSWLAGFLDAAGDLAFVLVTLAGAGAVILHGWTAHTVLLLAAMMLTSLLGTAMWTRFGRRIKEREA